MSEVEVAVLDELELKVRSTIIQHLAATGRGPSSEEVAEELGLSSNRVEQIFCRLEDAHAIALAPASPNVWMAHPFSAVPTPFPVETTRVRYWANCAWDMLGIPAALQVDSSTTTSCPDCGEQLTVKVRGGELEPTDTVVHFAVPPVRFWDNVGFT